MRERDVRNGTKELVSGAPFAMFPYVFQFLARPRWFASYHLDGGLMRFPNIVLPEGPMAYADVGAALEQSMVSWSDLSGFATHGRVRSSSRACTPPTMRGVPSTVVRRRSLFRITAAVSSMASRPRFAFFPRCSMP